MPLIPAKYVEPRETVGLSLERAVHARLRQYAEFIHSPKYYVVTQALDRLFRSDKEFVQWLAAREHDEPGRP